ncbi:hypothetical protein DS2_17817 [Catenovulum agarivorans DS-2]|uniref:Uncharacterized protein n=1 Tax=Catenovulum agarivorans DS-2 TaxID=1328313 RepID=W7QJP9_9ALTE|nr:hypothetical protein [Catenovulum agarivorans]EWH08368.1 hypothetical protein DS2_17817 [Catenovulum agarivorans DS-2]
MFEASNVTYSVNNSTITLRDDKKELLLVTPPQYQNIHVTRYSVELSDMQPEKRPHVKNVFLHEVFKRDKTFFFVKVGETEYQVDLKYQDNPITPMKF